MTTPSGLGGLSSEQRPDYAADAAEVISDREAISDVDPEVATHVRAIRDRFGISGLRAAAQLISMEIALARDALSQLEEQDEPSDAAHHADSR
jgi:hypothetical protein